MLGSRDESSTVKLQKCKLSVTLVSRYERGSRDKRSGAFIGCVLIPNTSQHAELEVWVMTKLAFAIDGILLIPKYILAYWGIMGRLL